MHQYTPNVRITHQHQTLFTSKQSILEECLIENKSNKYFLSTKGPGVTLQVRQRYVNNQLFNHYNYSLFQKTV